MRIFLTGILAAHLVVFFPRYASAKPQIEVHLEPVKGIRAQTVCYLIVQLIWRSREGDYRFSQPELILDNLTLEGAGEANETFQKNGEEWKKKLFHFDLKAIRAGRAKVRPFQIVYVESSQQASEHFEVEALELRVFPNNSRLYRAGLTAAGLLAAAVALGGWIFLRRRRKELEAIQASEPTLEERTLSRLPSDPQQLLEAGKIFRAYLSEKYSLSEGASTGREVLLKMKERISADELKTLKRIFDTLEERQYATPHRSGEECRKLYSEMVHYVESKKII